MGVETHEEAGAIWEAFRSRLKGFVLRRVPDEQDAEDILQDVFLKIHARLDTLKSRDSLEAWLFQITRNAISEHCRRRHAVPGELLEAARSREAAEEYTDEQSEEAARVIRSCLLSMLDALPASGREALMLTEIEQVTQKEMAERLGLSLSGAKSRVQRARDRLRNVLLECCHVEMDRRGNVIGYELHSENCRFCSPEPESLRGGK